LVHRREADGPWLGAGTADFGRCHHPDHRWQLPTAEPALIQIERILEINELTEVTKTVVEAARESLVIGQA
jgi:hypothetical protein